MELDLDYIGEMPKQQDERVYSDALADYEIWRQSRAGKVNASTCEKICGTTPTSAKLPFSSVQRLYDPNNAFFKYVTGMALEKHYGTYFRNEDIKAFKYGRIMEPLIKEHIEIKGFTFNECGNIEIIKDVFNCTPDGLLFDGRALEIKAAMSADSYYDRTQANYDKSHTDFWQTQAEMLACNCYTMLYCTALPVADTQSVIVRGYGLHTDLLGVHVRELKADKDAQEYLLARAKLAGALRDYWLENQHFSMIECFEEIKKLC
jgi:hypothetical protein